MCILWLYVFLVSLLTWVGDLLGVIEERPYCRIQRTVILALSVITFLSGITKSLAIMMLSYGIAFLDLSIGSSQILLHLQRKTFPNYNTLLVFLAASATILLLYFIFKKQNHDSFK